MDWKCSALSYNRADKAPGSMDSVKQSRPRDYFSLEQMGLRVKTSAEKLNVSKNNGDIWLVIIVEDQISVHFTLNRAPNCNTSFIRYFADERFSESTVSLLLHSRV